MAQAIPTDFVKDLMPKIEENVSPGMVVSKLRSVADSLEIPSKPLFGLLPIKRIIPMDVHSVADYADGFLTVGAGLFGNTSEAKLAGLVLGVSTVSVSLMTDYRLSLMNVIPIEVHEVIDYVWGASCIAAPFVLGYYKKDPIVAAAHIATGVLTIISSLFTDYRAAKGTGRSKMESASMMGATVQPGLSHHVDY
ncbi:SPW repeat domain-containing protein [Polyangium aurulentum]|uniref:SPW repeat domain-containing protein n=1 Tax=Polyangium aurulentum TaxID=2567896 RepID=UPI0010AE6BB6|nr:hypothetical protein [Polyangium aurulentum]UQA61960.1 hypothetical protein E8A73_016395 [Polyangium aurulentum]